MRARYLDPEEVARIEEKARGADVLRVAELTGLRVGDVVKIRVADLDEDGVRYVAEKTGKPGRAPLPPALVARLRKGAKYGWVFPSPRKPRRHITRQAIWARVKRASERAAIPPAGVSPHSLRKTYAVEKFKTEGIEAVRRALQHGDRRTTEIYALSDWSTGENADLPLLRRDLPLIIEKIVSALSEGID